MELLLQQVSKSYGDQLVIKPLDFTFMGPGLYMIYGPSGCGKTTMLNLLSAIEKPTGGCITRKAVNDIAIVFQHHYLIGELTCFSNVILPLQIKRISYQKSDILSRFSQLGLGHLIYQRVKYCSGGERQRVNILRAIAAPTQVLLADEPTGSVDEESAIIIRDLLVKLSRHMLVIIVSHHLELFKNLEATYLNLKNGTLQRV